MKKILILGSGLVAHPMIDYLLSKGYSIVVASNTPDRAEKMIAGNPNGVSLNWEADDEQKLDSLVADCDLVVSLLPYVFHPRVARHCLKNRKHLVTASYAKAEMKALDKEAREKGVILLNEMGLDPGIDHMSSMRIIDQIHGKGGAVL
ncbi:MAG: saccharopine dehydrogenase NADP-binding domain-containing protein, partial [Bacteroidota bacterium]|nr:saccharopine dehydrogenase NADP-binding domain-containing protein [Bacteroidota bacterium]